VITASAIVLISQVMTTTDCAGSECPATALYSNIVPISVGSFLKTSLAVVIIIGIVDEHFAPAYQSFIVHINIIVVLVT
jgi:hypothetical protein